MNRLTVVGFVDWDNNRPMPPKGVSNRLYRRKFVKFLSSFRPPKELTAGDLIYDPEVGVVQLTSKSKLLLEADMDFGIHYFATNAIDVSGRKVRGVSEVKQVQVRNVRALVNYYTKPHEGYSTRYKRKCLRRATEWLKQIEAAKSGG